MLISIIMRKIIATDIDDIKIPFNAHFIKFWNQVYGTTYRLSDITSFRYEEVFKCSTAKALEMIHAFYETPEFKAIAPSLPALHLIHHLQKNHELVAITSRAENIADFTCWQLAKYFPGIYSSKNIHFTNTYTRTGIDRKITKTDIGKKVGAYALIDDCLDIGLDYASHGRYAFLPEKPWNKHNRPVSQPTFFIPVRTLSEIAKHPLLQK